MKKDKSKIKLLRTLFPTVNPASDSAEILFQVLSTVYENTAWFTSEFCVSIPIELPSYLLDTIPFLFGTEVVVSVVYWFSAESSSVKLKVRDQSTSVCTCIHDILNIDPKEQCVIGIFKL